MNARWHNLYFPMLFRPGYGVYFFIPFSTSFISIVALIYTCHCCRYLHVTGDTFGRPIHGQSEVCAYPNPNDFNYWTTSEGVYIKPTEDTRESRESEVEHDEL